MNHAGIKQDDGYECTNCSQGIMDLDKEGKAEACTVGGE